MTKKESEILIAIGTDIKWLLQIREEDSVWLQKSLDRIENHLSDLNGSVANNTVGVAVNRNTIRLQWKVGAGLFSFLAGGLAIALHFMGVY